MKQASQMRFIFPGVGHAFANPSGGNYVPEEKPNAQDSGMQTLWNEIFQLCRKIRNIRHIIYNIECYLAILVGYVSGEIDI